MDRNPDAGSSRKGAAAAAEPGVPPATRPVTVVMQGMPLNPSQTFVPIRPEGDERRPSNFAALPDLPAMPAAGERGAQGGGLQPIRLPPRISRRPEALDPGQGGFADATATSSKLKASAELSGAGSQLAKNKHVREEDLVTPPPTADARPEHRSLDKRGRSDRGRSDTPW